MRWFWTVDDGVRSPFEVLVEAEPDAPLSALADALSLDLGQIAPGAPPEAPLAEAAPESGTVLPHRWQPPRPDHAVRLRGGPFAGHVVATGWPAGARALLVGRDEECDVVLGDPHVSRLAAVFYPAAAAGQARLVRPASAGTAPVLRNGSLVPVADSDDEPHPGVLVAPDDVVEIGASVLGIGAAGVDPADVHRGSAGELELNRPARIRPLRRIQRISAPGPRPEAGAASPVPWAMATVPVILGGALAAVSHQPLMLMMAVASPVMVIANYRSQRTFMRRGEASATAKWEAARADVRRRLAEAEDAERRYTWLAGPDPATIREECLARGARLWERRIEDDDALCVRVGLAEQPVPVELVGQGTGEQLPAPTMSPVPVSVDLRSAGVLGIAGPPAVAKGLGRWALLQLAALRSPRDLRLVVLCDGADEAAWRWVAWLPHTRLDDAGAPVALVGNTDATRAARLGELARLVEDRRHALDTERDARFSPDVVVLVDGARRLRALPGMATVLKDGPSVGVHAVCLDYDRVRLPEEAGAQVVTDFMDATMGAVEVDGAGTYPRVLLDAVTPDIAEDAARSLTPLTHVGGDGDTRQLPTTVRLVDLLGVDLTDPSWVESAWALGGRTSPRAVVGAGTDGAFLLDLAVDGPHALVAGTTGAGKSEFLQTLVVSLALGNRPDALTFVLIDYKGASAFADCANLPHTVGLVTNLDNRETERALASLDAELARRERALRDLSAKDVEDAWDRDARGAAAAGLARLVLVIDEFAELVHELPAFVTGLIRIARVGRSLGIHLVLATQRPAGVVSAEMQANLALRVALRMADRDNSVEVLGAGDAALISPRNPGRGYLRRASGAAPAAFQTARVAGRTPGARAASVPRPYVHRVGWTDLGEPVPPAPPGPAGDPDATDLHALVALANTAAEHLAIPRGRSPWLPALPAAVTVDSLRANDFGGGAGFEAGADAMVLGLLDVPAQQAQRPLRYRLGEGHLAVIGSARSGRSSILRTLLAEVARTTTPDDVHVYCVDFGGSALAPAADLPHCGAVVRGHETERVVRLLERLGQEVTARQQVLARGGFGDVREQRAAATLDGQAPLPYLLLVLDRWEGLVGSLALEELQVLRERVARLLREGPSVGLAVVVTGDRALLTDRILAFIETRWTLRLSDREDYRLAGLKPAELPEQVPDGRGYAPDPVREVQFALVGSDASGPGQNAALRAAVAAARERLRGTESAAGSRPFRLDVLPVSLGYAQACVLPDAVPVPQDGPSLLVGVGGDDLSRYRLDLSAGAGFLVTGPRRSGRSTFLATAARWLHEAGTPVLAVVPRRPSPLGAAASALGLDSIEGTGQEAAAALANWLAAHPESAALVVDDAGSVQGTALDDAVVEAARSRGPGTFVLVAAAGADEVGTALRGTIVEAKRARQGLLLWPGSALEGNAFGVGVPRGRLGRGPEGRGLLLVAGQWLAVQVPLPELPELPEATR